MGDLEEHHVRTFDRTRMCQGRTEKETVTNVKR